MNVEEQATEIAFNQVRELLLDEVVDEETQLKAFELYGRLWTRIGSVERRNRTADFMQLLEFIVTKVDEGGLRWADLEKGLAVERCLPMLRSFVERKGRTWESFVPGIWKAWLASPDRPFRLMRLENAWARDWFEFIPPEAMLAPQLAAILLDPAIPYERFRREQWIGFLAFLKQREQHLFDSHRGGAAWERMPLEFIRQAILEDVISEYQGKTLRALWRIASETVQDALRQLLSEGRWSSAWLYFLVAPPKDTPAIIGLLREHLHRPEISRSDVLMWLHRRISSRAPGWEEAWELLLEVAPERV
ncbi:hypothetical protein D7V97_40980 [Corallococcus sp. CA053C]|nr:hypothetical protein D7V97_40980 [Corallococcus sp. CA053C]